MIIRLLPFFLLVLVACSSSDRTSPSINMSGRREFEDKKYGDPTLGYVPPGIRNREREFVKTLPSALSKGESVQDYGTFEQVGPWNVGGRTRTFAIDVNNPDVFLAGGVSGGLWKSTDAGQSWLLVTKPEDLHTVTSIVQDNRPGRNNEWYYCTGEAYGNSAQITGNGIFKSTDNGNTWSVLPSTVSPNVVANHAFAYGWRINIDRTKQTDHIYTATSRHGLQRSIDGGLTWSTVLDGTSYFVDHVITPSGVHYAAFSSFTGYLNDRSTRWGVFRSADGTNWKNITPADMQNDVRRIVIGLIPSAADEMFVVAETPGEGTRGVFKLREGEREEWHSLWRYKFVSGDGSGAGGQWENRSANIPLFGGRNGDYFTQGGYDMLVRVSPTDTNVVVLGGTNLYLSKDAFRTTQNTKFVGGYGAPTPGNLYPSYPNHHPDQHEVVFHNSSPNVAFSLNDGGMMKTNNISADSVVWNELNNGYFTTQFYAIAIRDTANDEHVMGGTQDNGTWEGLSSDPHQPWVRRNGGDGAYCAYAEGGSVLYVSTQTGRVRRVILDDEGTETARTRVDPIGPVPDDYLFINPFAIDPADEKIMYQAVGPILYRNNDLSEIPLGSDDSTAVNWDSLPATRTSGAKISAVTVANEGHRVYYGLENGKLYRLDNANVGFGTPKEVLSKSGLLNCIAVHPTKPDELIACFSNYGVVSMFHTKDGGTTWSAVAGNLEDNSNGGGNGPAVNWASILPKADGKDIYICGTTSGLFLAIELNGMSTVWSRIAVKEIGNVPVDMVLSRDSDKRIFVGTHGRGVFSGRITSLPEPGNGPTLRSPLSNTRGILLDTVLKWNAVSGAVSYAVELSTDPTFATDTRVFDGVTADSTEVNSLIQGPVVYYWRVYAFSEGGRSLPSETWQFSTAVRAPALLDPATSSTNVPGLPVKLTWEHVPAAASYDVEVATNLTFNEIVFKQNGVTDTTINVGMLASNKRYFWHVRSVDADASGIWAARYNFTTGLLTSVAESELHSEITVTPNPASSEVRIEFPNDAKHNVDVELYSATGKRMFDAITQNNFLVVDTRGLPVGAYVVHITANKKLLEAPLQIVR